MSPSSLKPSARNRIQKYLAAFHMHFVVKGRGLTAEKVERAIALSVEKYCSASAMIAKTASIIHDFEIVDTAATGGGNALTRPRPWHRMRH